MALSRLLRTLLPGDEVLIAGFGLGAAAVVVAASGTLWWLTSMTERRTLEESREKMVAALGDSMAQSVETMLGNSEVSAVRRLVADAARDAGLSVCRVTLGDGKILADADPSRITAQTLPEQWPQLTAQPPATDGRTLELNISGKGRARLELVAQNVSTSLANSRNTAVVGMVAAGSLVGLGVVYRLSRRRTRGLGAIDDALSHLSAGEKELAALEVSPTLGEQAYAWNSLLRELVSLRNRELLASDPGRAAGGEARDSYFAAACNALWHGLVVADDALNITYANGAAAVFLGARRETLIGRPLIDVLGDSPNVAPLRSLADGTNRGRIVVESPLAASGQDAVFRLSARRLRAGEGSGTVLLIEDVTQQRVADKARNAFVAQATHELRAPLTNIRLYVEALLDKPDSDVPTRSKHLNVVNQEARRLERIVGDMLSVSEIEAGTMKLANDDVRLVTLFEEIENDFRISAQAKGVSLKLTVPPKLPVIVGDRDKIVLALSNLVGNAIKYTPTGGLVSVVVRTENDSLRVDVTDTGIGIAENEAELVFERFYRSKDRRIEGITGSGLGLALARQVVRLHGGDITLASELNKGSTFTLTLPARANISLAA